MYGGCVVVLKVRVSIPVANIIVKRARDADSFDGAANVRPPLRKRPWWI